MPPERRCGVDVCDEQSPELALLIAPNEKHAALARDHAKSVDPTTITPNDGPNVASHDRLKQPHPPEVGQIDAAPMLAFACSSDVIRPT
jgi:hypothetical protein